LDEYIFGLVFKKNHLRTSSLKDLRREMMRRMMTKTKGKAARMAPVWSPLSPPDHRRMAAERD